MKDAAKFTPCRFNDCLYYGKVDEFGYTCDEKQVIMCEYVRTREEERVPGKKNRKKSGMP